MAADIVDIFKRQRDQIQSLKQAFDGGGGGGYDEGMEARVAKLEESAADTRDRLVKIEARLEQTATKSDLTEAINNQIKWMVGTAVVLGGLGITLMTFVLNNAIPKPAAVPAQLPQPIVVYPQPVPAITTPAPAAKPPAP